MLLASINESMEHIGFGEAGIVALMGYIIVFVGLIALMLVVMLTGKIMVASLKRKKAEPLPAAPSVAAAPQAIAAPGSAGRLKLYDVPDKDAAMVMAIVANKLQKPLNELRFQSIREVH
jgi:hypothetical protein